MYILFILIALAVCIALYFYLNKIYNQLTHLFGLMSFIKKNKNTCDETGASFLNNYLTLHYPPALHFMRGFTNISYNIILKFIIFVVSILIINFTDSLIIAFIYGSFFLGKDFLVHSSRRKMFKDIETSIREEYEVKIYTTTKKAYTFIPVYSILTVLLCYLVLLF